MFILYPYIGKALFINVFKILKNDYSRYDYALFFYIFQWFRTTFLLEFTIYIYVLKKIDVHIIL